MPLHYRPESTVGYPVYGIISIGPGEGVVIDRYQANPGHTAFLKRRAGSLGWVSILSRSSLWTDFFHSVNYIIHLGPFPDYLCQARGG